MIIHNIAAAAAPIAYEGGLASSGKPAFANTLQATLTTLQATKSGTAALLGGATATQPATALFAATQNGKGHNPIA